MIELPTRRVMEERLTSVLGIPLDDLFKALSDTAGQTMTSELFASRLLTAANGFQRTLHPSAADIFVGKLPDFVRALVPDEGLHTRVLALVTT